MKKMINKMFLVVQMHQPLEIVVGNHNRMLVSPLRWENVNVSRAGLDAEHQ
jgi:hypothetical protein